MRWSAESLLYRFVASVLQILTCGIFMFLVLGGFVWTVPQILSSGMLPSLAPVRFVAIVLQIRTFGIFLFLVPGRFVPTGLQILTSGAFLCSTEWLTNRHSAFDQMMIKKHRNLENIDENHENYDENV